MTTGYDQSKDRMVMSASEHHAAKMPARRARQGIAPGHVRYMLATGLALVIVAFAIIYYLNA